MPLAQDPFYVVKEEIQESVSSVLNSPRLPSLNVFVKELQFFVSVGLVFLF